MGRLTEYFDFINSKTKKTKEEDRELYSNLTITKKIEKIRKEHLKRLKATL